MWECGKGSWVWVGKSWRTMDGSGAGWGSCGRGMVGVGARIGKKVGGGSGSGWTKVGGERNKKLSVISGSPSIV